MKKFMVMAAAALMALAANAQTSPEAKAIKKMKSYDEVLAALKANGCFILAVFVFDVNT